MQTYKLSTIGIDVDGVVADLHRSWLYHYNQDYNDGLSVKDLCCWDIDRLVKPECGMKIYEYLDDPGLYDTVLPTPGAIEAIESLRDMGHKIVFVTSARPAVMGVKYRWLQRYGLIQSLREYIEALDKSMIKADILIDDYLQNIMGFLISNPTGFGIVFGQPWNAAAPSMFRYERVFGYTYKETWNKIVSLIRRRCYYAGK